MVCYMDRRRRRRRQEEEATSHHCLFSSTHERERERERERESERLTVGIRNLRKDFWVILFRDSQWLTKKPVPWKRQAKS